MGKKSETQMVFQRYEIKYLLDRKQKEMILAAMEPYMEPDRYGRSTVRNIYYDTENYRLVRTSLDKPVYKEKLRVRSYRQTEDEGEVFVELKKKFDSVVYKRRFGTAQARAMEYLAGRMPPSERSQITEEIDYFLKFYGNLEPKVFLSYEREAYSAKAEKEAEAVGKRNGDHLRITFDENILWRQQDLSLTKGVYGEAILRPGQVLMELKTSGSLPLWMVQVLSREKIRKTTFSKYGNAYQLIMMREKGESVYA